MRAAQIVPAHVERNSMFQVLQFPAVRVRQAGEAAKVHSQTKVGAFNMASRDVMRIGMSGFDAWDRSHNPLAALYHSGPGTSWLPNNFISCAKSMSAPKCSSTAGTYQRS